MVYIRPVHGSPFADGSSTDLTVVLDALSDGLEAVEAAAAAVAASYATNVSIRQLSLVPPVAHAPVVTADSGQPRIADIFSGYVWGVKADGTIWRQVEAGGAWSSYCPAPDGSMDPRVGRLLLCDDGEVLFCSGVKVQKSSGWSGGSPTWSTKVSSSGAAYIPRWGIDGDGTKFIVSEYSATRPDSRYCYVSTDEGDTFTLAYDSVTKHGSTDADLSHLHGCCYDPWGDRFYLSEGHGTIAGIYCSTDDGATWARAAGMVQDPAPTTLTATDDGLVCGSDNVANGLYGVARQDDPASEVLTWVWRWGSGRNGVAGFADRGFRDPDTGIVYVSFYSDFADVTPVVAGGTPSSGAHVYTWAGTAAAGDRVTNVLISGTRLLGLLVNNAVVYGHLEAVKLSPGVPIGNQGNIEGGTSTVGDSVAVGPGATVGSSLRSVVVGAGSEATGVQDSVAVGDSASAVANATAIGASAAVTGAYSTVVGQSGEASGTNAVAVGYLATANDASAVSVGKAAVSSGSNAVSVGNAATAAANSTAVGQAAAAAGAAATSLGYTASAVGTGGTALGSGAVVSSGHTSSVALGRLQTTTAANQIRIGAAHLELAEVTAPTAPAADGARIYAVDNGSGKTQICVRFASGAVQVIATEP